jgi:hypothetical protein
MATAALTRLSYLYDMEVQGSNPDNCTCKPSICEVVVTTRKDVPPLEREVGEYSAYIFLMPLETL